ncbi:MAG TPA: AAA family ATPase [Gemmatales bacterium]|nr:AAA family ATPase [Gemmatales bacterium]
MAEDPLQPLREALAFSPENLPLRLHLAESLLKYGRGEEAEREYKDALARHPKDNRVKLGLAQAYHHQAKYSTALVIVEDLVKNDDTPGAYILYARLLFQRGEVERAVRVYKQGVELDASVADGELAGKLGIGAEAAESEVVDGRVRNTWEASDEEPTGDVERPKINFSDVGGMESLKDEIRLKIIHPLAHPELYQAYGKTIGGGILMYGPPGCGKTHLARATAGEVKASFMSIGINDVLEMWIGSSERNLHSLFEQARRNKPCVLFFDEVDALGASRTDFKTSAGRQVINQFLSELDGVNTSNDGVLILAATNTPWHLDTAFRRPGRFDRILFVPPPDAAARAAILRIVCKGKPQENIDFEQVAKKTDQFSGADLKAVIDQAIEAKLREAMKTGIPKPLTTSDLIAAAKTLKPTTKEWFATARNYAMYANQAGLYDDILKYVK